MSDKFFPISLSQLLKMIFDEYRHKKSIFGIPEELFFRPSAENALRQEVFDQAIDTPFGIAAGPHSQLSHNIVAAWLTGARYIELKTVQTLDELEVSKPCIDMQDEGYNCEWSQELKIQQSFDEYLNAWIAIHILNHKLGMGKDPAMVFNMSVGYNLEGILKENVQWFFEKMNDCTTELREKIQTILPLYPEAEKLNIPAKLSGNVTLSTMHGCPANEIESIARYLMEEKGLHTYVKLNPTLLGPQKLRYILNERLNFKTRVPEQAFEHDLKYADALSVIRSLQQTAGKKNLEFGLKLTNTLESANNKDVFENDVEMMYMSGRALHPLSINLASLLQQEFKGQLHLSFSGGADAFNAGEVLGAGFKTVTMSTDLLKPGGYMRLGQYIENLEEELNTLNAGNLESFIRKTGKNQDPRKAALSNLKDYAEKVLESPKYQRDYLVAPDIKTPRKLDYFDCISAPCRDTCATSQDVPEYMYFTGSRKFDKAYEVILRTNPFPSVTGMVCDHLCQNKCTRVHYDESLLIREVKRFISEQEEVTLQPAKANGIKAAIVGAGPAGLSCAYFLAMSGFSVEVYETKSKAGGMVQYAIPGFRLTEEAMEKDFKRITDTGVTIHYNREVDRSLFEEMKSLFDYLFVAPGAQLSAPLNLEGIEAKGVLDSLDFLFKAKQGEKTGTGQNVVIIGGGNTAMDAARTAYRLVGKNGKVTVVYRRTIDQMPADQGEIKAVLKEGMEIVELAVPEKVLTRNNRISGLRCSKMELKDADASGRPRPVKIEGSEFDIPCDTLIPAVGQSLDVDFMEEDLLKTNTETYQTRLKNVFTGGDALRGASTAINAIGDGRKAAEEIIRRAGIDFHIPKPANGKELSYRELMLKRAKRAFAPDLKELPTDERKNFKLIQQTLDEESIAAEATRCLYCDEICSICTTVCPNFANYAYTVEPVNWSMEKAVRGKNNEVVREKDNAFQVDQSVQILNIANFCNECGNCTTFCPTSGSPYKDKPKLHLTLDSFKESEEGYYLARLDDRKNLIYKHEGRIKTLSETADEFIYETEFVMAKFSKTDFALKDARLLTPCVKLASFHEAAIMRIIMQGADQLVYE